MPVSSAQKKKIIFALSALSIFCLLFFAITTTLTYGPVAITELNYQYHKTLQNTFGVSSLRALIVPQLDMSNFAKTTLDRRMQIPALFLDEPIIFNVSADNPAEYQAALKQGIAQAAGTAFPGYPGLSYYFAHSSHPDVVSKYNAVFYLLGKLQVGDKISIWYDQKEYVYHMTKREITEPTEVSFVTATYDRPTIVLQTCWPPGSTKQRLLIFGELE